MCISVDVLPSTELPNPQMERPVHCPALLLGCGKMDLHLAGSAVQKGQLCRATRGHHSTLVLAQPSGSGRTGPTSHSPPQVTIHCSWKSMEDQLPEALTRTQDPSFKGNAILIEFALFG